MRSQQERVSTNYWRTPHIYVLIFDSWGVYRLTDPPGMKMILNCTNTGLFHPHDSGTLYTDALRPGHVFEAKGLEFDVHDMRSGNY